MKTGRKLLCAALTVLLLVPLLLAPAQAATQTQTTTYYVVTADRGPLNVRSSPFAPADNVIGSLEYAAAVRVRTFTDDRNWAIIVYGSRTAYVMTRYLSLTRPGYDPQPTAKPVETMEDVNKIFRAMKKANYDVVTRPTRASGWVNLRWAPSLDAEVIQRCYDGYQLHVIQQSGSWAMAEDESTGAVGFILMKYLVTVSEMRISPRDPGSPYNEELP